VKTMEIYQVEDSGGLTSEEVAEMDRAHEAWLTRMKAAEQAVIQAALGWHVSPTKMVEVLKEACDHLLNVSEDGK